MVDMPIQLTISSIDQNHRALDSKARSHRNSTGQERKPHNHRCKSQERYRFDHNLFTHSKVIKASHDIPHENIGNHEHKPYHDEHHRIVVIKKRLVSENIFLDAFPAQ